MKSLQRLNNKQAKRHFLIWFIIIAYFNLIDPLPGTWSVKIIGSALINLNYIYVFYSISLYIFPKYWLANRFHLILSNIACLLSFWISMYFVYFKIIPYLGGHTPFQDYTIDFFLMYEISFFTIVGAGAASSFFSRYSIFKLKGQTEKEKSLLVKELNFLKNQFNSHITFNFLSYCYSKTFNQLPEVGQSIELFSDMLRYTIQTKPEEKVPLNSEIVYIENFIKLQKLLSAKVFVNFSYDGEITDKLILPRILITFVENAFKHGLYNDAQYPIIIYLKVELTKLTFNIENRVQRNKSLVSSNTGLENVTQILDLYYHDNYKLICSEKEQMYHVSLIINIHESPKSADHQPQTLQAVPHTWKAAISN
jgi:two-component system, LytTR family, sensor kinase